MMRTLAFLFVSFLLVFPACSQDSGNAAKTADNSDANLLFPAGGTVDAATFKTRLEEFSAEGILVDIRTPMEFNSWHMEGAQNIDFYENSFNSEINKLPRDKPIFIYCHSGNRSGRALERMSAMGFKYVYDLGGGASNWPYRQ